MTVPARKDAAPAPPYLCIALKGKRGGIVYVTETAYPLIADTSWYLGPNGYPTSFRFGLMHRRIMAADSGEHIDHKNFNRLDNRYENLRCCTQSENNKHRQKKRNSKWPYKGIRKNGLRWYARIMIDSVEHYLGGYATPEDAAMAYDAAARRAFGHNSVCNFREEE